VRAPGLNLHWLVKAVLATDKVYWEVLPLSQLLDRLRELERAAADRHEDVQAWLSSPSDDPELTCIRVAAAGLDAVAAATGPDLRDRVTDDILQVQACVERGDLLEQVTNPGPHG